MTSIAHHLQAVIGAAEDGDTSRCITIEAAADPSRWVQLTWDALNFAYPLTEAPAEGLARCGVGIPDCVELTDWEPGKYATFEHGADHVAVLVQFVDAYARQVLGIDLQTDSITVVAETL
jgi:hypothetical protein